MSGVALIIEGEKSLEEAVQRLNAFGRRDLMREMLDSVGGEIVSQTTRRITREKRSPEGVPWKPNITGTPILEREGELVGSIDHEVMGDEVRVGSGLVYAAIHQFGGTIRPKRARKLRFWIGKEKVFADSVTIPARPYLGLSAENRDEIEAVVTDWLEEVLAA